VHQFFTGVAQRGGWESGGGPRVLGGDEDPEELGQCQLAFPCIVQVRGPHQGIGEAEHGAIKVHALPSLVGRGIERQGYLQAGIGSMGGEKEGIVRAAPPSSGRIFLSVREKGRV